MTVLRAHRFSLITQSHHVDDARSSCQLRCLQNDVNLCSVFCAVESSFVSSE